jgi:hypothetical protein
MNDLQCEKRVRRSRFLNHFPCARSLLNCGLLFFSYHYIGQCPLKSSSTPSFSRGMPGILLCLQVLKHSLAGPWDYKHHTEGIMIRAIQTLARLHHTIQAQFSSQDIPPRQWRRWISYHFAKWRGLRNAKRFHTMVGFIVDIGLKEATDIGKLLKSRISIDFDFVAFSP